MRRKLTGLGLALSLAAVFATGCGSAQGSVNASAAPAAESEKEAQGDKEDKTIKVGACVTPHAEILGQIKDNLAEKGYTLEVIEYNDYVLPNTALEDGDLDANYFQHKPYLDDFNKENGTHIVTLAAVHFEPMASHRISQAYLTGHR